MSRRIGDILDAYNDFCVYLSRLNLLILDLNDGYFDKSLLTYLDKGLLNEAKELISGIIANKDKLEVVLNKIQAIEESSKKE